MWSSNEGNWNPSWSSAPPSDGEVGGHHPTAAFSAMNYHLQGSNPQQVDWAALAQQWIQMKQQPTQEQPLQQGDVQQHQIPMQDVSENPVGKQSSNPDEEVATSAQGDNTFPGIGNVLLSQLHGGHYWNDDEPAVWTPPLTNQAWIGPGARPKETFDYGHSAIQANPIAPSSNTQTYDYNHRGSDNLAFDQDMYSDQYWNEPVEPETTKYTKDRRSWNNHQPAPPEIDMVKRKSLPSWIREGLEKMEREKQKKLDKEKKSSTKGEETVEESEKEEAEETWVSRSRFDSESDNEDNAHGDKPRESDNQSSPSIKEPSPVPQMTEAEREQDLMLRMRRMLTEILLEVTNEEIRNVVLEVTQKALTRKSLEAKHLASSSALASLAGNLGLGSYASDSEDESENERQKHTESDSDTENIHEKARRKRMEFERRQLEWIQDEGDGQESKSIVDRDSSPSDDDGPKDSIKSRAAPNFSNILQDEDTLKYHFEERYSLIPGLDVPIKSENLQDSSENVKKQKRLISHSENKSSKRRKKSKSRSRSRSQDQRQSRSSSRGHKRSKHSEHSNKSRSKKHERRGSYDKHGRKRPRSRDRSRRSISNDSRSSSNSSTSSHRKRYRSRSRNRRSYSRDRRSRSRGRRSRSRGRRSRSRGRRSRSRGRRSYSRDKSRSKKSRRESRTRSRSTSPRRSSKYRYGKSRSGKKSS